MPSWSRTTTSSRNSAACRGKAGNLRGAEDRRRQYLRRPARERLSQQAAAARPRRRAVRRGGEEARLSPVPAALGQCQRRLYQPRRRDDGRMRLLRLLRALRLRIQRQGVTERERAVGDDGRSEVRAAHARLCEEPRLRPAGQEREVRHLCRSAQRRGIRAAGGHRHPRRLCVQQRAPDADCGHRPALRSGDRAAASSARTIATSTPTRACRVFFEDKEINPFMAAGAFGTIIDDFNGDNFDHSGARLLRRRPHLGGHVERPADRDARRRRRERRAGAKNGNRRPRNGTDAGSTSAARRATTPTARTISISIRPTRTRSAGR